MSDDRVFSEQQVSDIMKRAVALQEEAKASPYRAGVTQDELARAAKEMGVDPACLEQAIREKLTGAPEKGSGFLKEEQRVVEGELDPQDFDIILSQVRSRRRHPIVQVGRSLQGRTFTGSGLANLEVTSRNGRTRINLKPFPILEVLGTFYPAFIITSIGGSALADKGFAGVAAAIAAGAFAAAAIGFKFWLGRSRQATARLADKIQGVVQDQVTEDVRSRLAAPVTAPTVTEKEVEEHT